MTTSPRCQAKQTDAGWVFTGFELVPTRAAQIEQPREVVTPLPLSRTVTTPFVIVDDDLRCARSAGVLQDLDDPAL
jgi:hypothetical protein